MSRRLDRAILHRERVGPTERILGARHATRWQDFIRYGAAGSAVAELVQFVHGLAMAHDLPAPPSCLELSPTEGELAADWADRVMVDVLSWHTRWFVEDETPERAAGIPARTSTGRA